MPKIVWQSNSPLAGTGYGNQTYIFTKLLKEAGWEVIVAANYGLSGSQLEYDGITILPKGLDMWGNDVIKPHYEAYKPDVYMTLFDVWILKPEAWKDVPLAAWIPVDHDPAPPAVLDMSAKIPFPIAMSKFGESTLRDHAIDPLYMPHGVVTNIFEPMDRSEARKRFHVEDDTFFVVMNAANKGQPSRKGFEAVLKAWSLFVKDHPKSQLYMHTLPLPVHQGLDLFQLVKYHHITPEHIRFPHVYDYVMGNYKWDYLVNMYNAADCVLAPSSGEGFGIPVIEAHSCGCPTIVSDFTAQAELGSAYKIPINKLDDLITTGQYSEWVIPRVSAILEGLEYMYEHRGDMELREKARVEGLRYDALKVFEEHMLPNFDTIMQLS